jgi:hypothetical protein
VTAPAISDGDASGLHLRGKRAVGDTGFRYLTGV